MGYLSSADKVRLQQQLTLKQQQLDSANATYAEMLKNGEVQSYTFDSGEGRQSGTRRSPAELSKEIRALENDIDRLTRQLRGSGLCSMNLRRW